VLVLVLVLVETGRHVRVMRVLVVLV